MWQSISTISTLAIREMFFNYLLVFPLATYYVLGFIFLVFTGKPTSNLFVPVVLGVVLVTIPFLSKRKIEIRELRNFEVLTLVGLQLLVIVCLANIDYSGIRLTTESIRVESIWEKLLISHLLLSWMAALLLTGYITAASRWIQVAAIALIFQSVLIGVIEGRRTAAILPFVFLVFLALGKDGASTRRLLRAGAIAVVLISAFGIVTSIRTGSAFVMEMLFSRVFWPAIALNDILLMQPNFDPQTLPQVGSRIMENFGGVQYLSTTNEFGRYMGYISPNNHVVGINYGVIGESVLAGGVLFPLILQIVLLSILSFSMRIASLAPFNLAMLLPFLYVHGYQMEIPYTIVVLLKAGLLFGLVSAFMKMLPERER